MQSERDRDWMTRLHAGDDTAVAEIRERYEYELRLFCQRMVYSEPLAEDIVQDVMLRCCRPGRGEKPSGSLRGWLYRVARNRSIDELRKMRPQVRLSAAKSSSGIWFNAAVPIDPATTPAGRAIKEDRAQRVQLALDDMEDNLREVVILYFYQGLSRMEVAEAVGLSLGGAKARLAKATRLLRGKLRFLDDSSV